MVPWPYRPQWIYKGNIMLRYLSKPALATALACLGLAGGTAFASPAVEGPISEPKAVVPASAAAAPAGSGEQSKSGLGEVVAGSRLDAERGKADLGNSEANLGGVVSGNSATNVTTGGNTIDTGSFSNMSGLPVVIQNTGANVLIQNATVINVMFK